MKKTRTLKISLRKWQHGGRHTGDSKLLDVETKRMCCLGFAAIQLCGADRGSIYGCSTPASIPRVFKTNLHWLLTPLDKDSEFAGALMDANDGATDANDKVISLKDRKKKIKTLFAKKNIRVVFVP